MADCIEGDYADWGSGDGRAVTFYPRTTPAFTPLGGIAKRCFDFSLSLFLLPLVVLLALPIACLIGGTRSNPFYSQWRVGWNGRLFRCYKFRTMVAEAEDTLSSILERDPAARLQWFERSKLENDPRVTTVGRFLRCTNLDEMPQIWNVLRGEMSWVGPRPVVPDELHKYGAEASAYVSCRPGISGLWQIMRRRTTTYDERVAFDVEYFHNWSFARDIVILLRTVPWMFALRNRF